MVAIITIVSVAYTTASSLLPSQSSYVSFAQVQTNSTIQQQDKNNKTNTNYEKFHADIEQIIGHIKMAEFNKNKNNNTLAYNHTSHPIEEVLSLVTIPISNADKKLNDTYFKDLYTLSALVNPSSQSSISTTKEAFSKQAQSSIDFSNNVIKTVIPAKTLNNPNHNATVIQSLLNTSKGEYEEGVKDGKIVSLLEYQDGTAFMDRAYFLFNNTKSIANNDKDRQEISEIFANLTQSTQQQKNPDEINKIIDEINKELSEGSSTSGSTANLTSPSYSSPATNTTSNANSNSTSLSYISKIRALLDQVVVSYTANDTSKAKELATTAYLDNFENIEKPIGKELADTGEQLLRAQLRDQISAKAPLSEVKQTIGEAQNVLDKAETVLK
jgi:hypothetical protein